MIPVIVVLAILTKVNSTTLKGCNDSWQIESAGNICKLQQNYSRLDFPRPTPCHIQPEFRVQEIVDINEEYQTITLAVKFVLKWKDDRIDYHFPNVNETGVYHPWYLLDETLAAEIWIPNIIFPQSVVTQKPIRLARGSLWYKHPQNLFLQTMERLTLACQMTFNNYPFDSHTCTINLANFIGKSSLVVMDPLKIYPRNESQTIAENKLVVHDEKLRFDLTLTSKESIISNEFGYEYSWAQVEILLVRKSKESKYLWGSYFGSTLTFAVLSLASFCIQVDKVPGRIGLLITLFLISINNYNSLIAPSQRGISYIEIWFIGMQIPMLGAILEYAILLSIFKFKEKVCYFRFIQNHVEDLESWVKAVDLTTLCISFSYIILFNGAFWSVCYFQ